MIVSYHKRFQKLVYLSFYYYPGSFPFQLLLAVQNSLLKAAKAVAMSLRSDFSTVYFLPCCLPESPANAWQYTFCLEGNYDEKWWPSQRGSLLDYFFKDHSCNRFYVVPYWSIYIYMCRTVPLEKGKLRDTFVATSASKWMGSFTLYQFTNLEEIWVYF